MPGMQNFFVFRQYASSPDSRAYCWTEFTVSSLWQYSLCLPMEGRLEFVYSRRVSEMHLTVSLQPLVCKIIVKFMRVFLKKVCMIGRWEVYLSVTYRSMNKCTEITECSTLLSFKIDLNHHLRLIKRDTCILANDKRQTTIAYSFTGCSYRSTQLNCH